MKLSQQQIEKFHSEGFLHLKGVFSPDEINVFKQLSAKFPTAKTFTKYIHAVDGLETLWSDNRLLAPARQLLDGPLVYYYSATFSRYVFEPAEHISGRHLHHDAKGAIENIYNRQNQALDFTYPVLRAAIYLQDTARQSGGLKVVPKSHLIDVSAFDYGKLQFYNLPSQPGDVVLLTNRLLHSPFALRLKNDPDVALMPLEEEDMFASDPMQFLSTPCLRETIFIDYGSMHELSDIHIKHTAVLASSDPSFLGCFFDRGVMQEHGDPSILVRVDAAITSTANLIAQLTRDGNEDAAAQFFARLAALCRVHWETSQHYVIHNSEVPDNTVETGRRIFNEIWPRVVEYREMKAKARVDQHMGSLSQKAINRLTQTRRSSSTPTSGSF